MKINLILLTVLTIFAGFMAGCAAIGQKGKDTGEYLFRPVHQSPSESQTLAIPYRQTEIGQSTSADVIEYFVETPHAVISQSESVVGLYGADKDRKKAWFNIVAFDEDSLTAKRKYFLSSYDRPKEWFVLKEKLRFDASIMIDPAIMNEAYANADAKRIAILREVRRKFNQDIQQLTKFNRDIGNIGMLANQSMNIVLTELSTNPAYAEQLEYFEGLDFDHPTLDEGKIRLAIDPDGNIVRLKIKIGSVIDDWSRQTDVIDMGKF